MKQENNNVPLFETGITVYKFISESGDRRSKDYKTLSNHYDSLCIKENSGRYMETPKAKEFGNMNKQQALKLIS